MEAITATRVGELHPVFQSRFTQLDQRLAESSLAIQLRLTQGIRTWAGQDELYAKGRTTPGVDCKHGGVVRPVGSCPQHPLGLPVTKAKGGESAHNFGYAGDAVPNDPDFPDWHGDWSGGDERWKVFLATAKECGFAEGAEWRTFPDAPHLYLPELPATPDDNMRYLYREGGLAAVWRDWEGKF
jgi:peptidoglycan L-alanyl-D-glutamate endopeptidase CwlK